MEILNGLKVFLVVAIAIIPFMWLGMLTSYGKHKKVPLPNMYDWIVVTIMFPGFFLLLGGVISFFALVSNSNIKYNFENLAVSLLLITWGIQLNVLMYKLIKKSETKRTKLDS